MNANTIGALYVKGQRINDRIKKAAEVFLNMDKHQNSISREDFKDFIRTLYVINNSELNEKGVERKWTR